MKEISKDRRKRRKGEEKGKEERGRESSQAEIKYKLCKLKNKKWK